MAPSRPQGAAVDRRRGGIDTPSSGCDRFKDAADDLIARAKLELDAGPLPRLCFRLGPLYADRLSHLPMALKTFQRALTYQPDDKNPPVRLADLTIQARECKLALGAGEGLVN